MYKQAYVVMLLVVVCVSQQSAMDRVNPLFNLPEDNNEAAVPAIDSAEQELQQIVESTEQELCQFFRSLDLVSEEVPAQRPVKALAVRLAKEENIHLQYLSASCQRPVKRSSVDAADLSSCSKPAKKRK